MSLPAVLRRRSTLQPKVQEWHAQSSGSTSTGSPMPPHSSPQSSNEDKESLVRRVKDIQKSSPGNKQAWYHFCQTLGSSDYDPMRHCKDNLKRFLHNQAEGKTQSRLNSSRAAGADASGSGCGDASWDSWWWGPEAAGGKSSSSSAAAAAAAAWQGSKGAPPGKDAWQGKDPWGAMAPWAGSGPPDAGSWDGVGSWPGQPPWQGKGDWQGEDAWPMAEAFEKGMMKGMAKGGGMTVKGGVMTAASKAAYEAASSAAKSEFGILDSPPEELLAKKRGAASIMSMLPAQGGGGLMTEEQAKLFQQSLKRKR